MALIKCPECGKEVSNKAKTCPNCGFAVSDATNDLIRIKIDRDPSCAWTEIRIFKRQGHELLTKVRAGTVAEIRSNKEIEIQFQGLTEWPMCFATVSPKDGGKYRAVWGAGFFSPTITSCFKVDDIDF